MKKENIEELLDKYWLCETTMEEEKELYQFFMEEDVPEHLTKYKELFRLKTEEREPALDEQFDTKILSLIAEKEKTIKRYKVSLFFKVAAAAVIFLVVCLNIQPPASKENPWEQDTYETPEEALAEVQRVFNFVSDQFERGQDIVDKNMKNVEPVTKLFR
ncbi:pyruvate ferredoxin oxidoreductase [Bacteroides sp. 224]|uniref:pyruvate ferredoxin oxidoreductase n=1 Tax=Bacteroides sp. 224 TaxID=2302936 RepID=UPI0013D48427|nr:pyruvate ferredoxin oxidoreductase [Bacteroides sp. 224]NDV66591.1 pyruvate ferredoxin oxidoreductase [Bacteroides sp. 224]